MNWIDVVSAVLMIGGALSCLLGAIGLLSFPDVAARLQAATKPQTLGLILVLIGAALQLGFPEALALALVGLFQMLTAPIVAQLVGRAAYRADSIRRDTLVIDELGERLDRERGSAS
ncbi:multisubunit sodium/proton antiporter MrpG subunit [Saccharopolyspora erythraea NRRL 2338]|uniref:Monovalent cation/H(+) antiporter subunit G n=2 Tax=Saccharopolyspora erythraea TaxID=1836 RepID=A0ABP3N7R2_SACER|nr:monovalent cation/H(+) antiporter subunit G [Saccharopolyspora erythraea]EQD85030.1 sodium:proton antiporter [Saccharopolyspora erythraea D]PFG99347.1 multisubunit sodium/proton antiporter MrpG subunit [Saccharopolyspora erythraea NRRL 2338]QRK89274.1 monovalent cation/H(+) antiporter subunit G [Saccharopolyspora erythraea]CAM05707.1 probable multisubunit Na+:H+ antiporter MnhG subunit [Saccharopolyspora erythraea NRRL 2338]